MTPNRYESVAEMLEALGFTTHEGQFTKGDLKIPADKIMKHTPATFYEKMKREGWVGAEEKGTGQNAGYIINGSIILSDPEPIRWCGAIRERIVLTLSLLGDRIKAQWTDSCPISEFDRYELQWAESANFLGARSYLTIATIPRIFILNIPGGKYFARVRVAYYGGLNSPWSLPVSMTMPKPLV